MQSPAGFVAPSAACLRTTSFAASTCSSPRFGGARLSRARAAPCRSARMQAGDGGGVDGAEEEAEKVIGVDVPPEPYPGFYADMLRSGLSQEDAEAQAYKVQVRKDPSLAKASGKLGGEKSLIGADGKALAPWMKNVRTDLAPKVIGKKGDARGRLAGDPQDQELSGQGLQWKLLGDELELTWATGREDNNRGFVITRRQGKSEMWRTVSDYKDKPAELASKGSQGGNYSFLIPVEPGSWIYRVSDEDGTGKISDLSQTLVDIDSSADSSNRLAALGALLFVIFGFVAFSLINDPLSGPI